MRFPISPAIWHARRTTGCLRWKVASPGSTTLNIVADIEGLPEFKDWAFIVTVGMPFDAIINPVPDGTEKTARENIVQLTCYGNSSGYLPGFASVRPKPALCERGSPKNPH